MLGLSPPKAVPMPIFARGDLHSSIPAALDTRPLYAQFGVVEGGAAVYSARQSRRGQGRPLDDRSITAGHFDHRPRKKAENEMASRAGCCTHFPIFPLPLRSPRGVNKLGGGERGCRIILRYAHEIGNSRFVEGGELLFELRHRPSSTMIDPMNRFEEKTSQ